ILPIERSRWMITVGNRGVKTRPTTWDGFLDELCRLNTPTLYDVLRRAKPPSGIQHFACPTSTWRHFERLPRMPRGLVPVGTPICLLNPIYGQGMSSAAKQAVLLKETVQEAAGETDPIAAAQAGFLTKVPEVLGTPWHMTSNADLAFPTTRGERPANFE